MCTTPNDDGGSFKSRMPKAGSKGDDGRGLASAILYRKAMAGGMTNATVQIEAWDRTTIVVQLEVSKSMCSEVRRVAAAWNNKAATKLVGHFKKPRTSQH